MAKTPLRGLIFDVDGTLGDTVPLCYEAFRRALLPFKGRLFSDDEIQATFGRTEEGISQLLEPRRWRQLFESYVAHYRTLHSQYARPFPEMVPLLEWLQARGLRLAVVTGKGPVTARITLVEFGLARFFELVETGSTEGPIKPQGMLNIVRAWGVPPSEAAYVGDTPYDVRACREAGVPALGAAWASTAQPTKLRAEKPAAVFTNVDELREWVEGHPRAGPA